MTISPLVAADHSQTTSTASLAACPRLDFGGQPELCQQAAGVTVINRIVANTCCTAL